MKASRPKWIRNNPSRRGTQDANRDQEIVVENGRHLGSDRTFQNVDLRDIKSDML